jgi:predicted dehydrogenase
VAEVFAHGAPPRTFNTDVPPAYSIEDAMVVSLRFAGGAVATIYNTCAANADGGVNLSVFGAQHAAHFSGWDHTLRLVSGAPNAGPQERTEETIAGEPEIFAIEDRRFIDAVKGGDKDLVLADYPDGVKTLEVSLAANLALESRRPVQLA